MKLPNLAFHEVTPLLEIFHGLLMYANLLLHGRYLLLIQLGPSNIYSAGLSISCFISYSYNQRMFYLTISVSFIYLTLKVHMGICTFVFCSTFLKKILFTFREKEKEREGNIDAGTPMRDWTYNPGMCPDLELNQRPFALCSTIPWPEVF